jgi:hypothetical protein
MLQLAAYLSAARQTDPSREVGGPLEVEFDRGKYQSQVKFIMPQGGPTGTLPVEATASGERLKASLPGDATQSGLYTVQFTTPDNRDTEAKYYAYNVAAAEGDLKIASGEQLETRLAPVKFRFHRAADALFDTDDFDRSNMSRLILYALIGLLVLEQLLSYSCSYHPTAREMARSK